MHILIDATCISDVTFGTSQYATCLLHGLSQIDHENTYSVLIKQGLSEKNFIFKLVDQNNFRFIRTPIRIGGPLQQFKLCLPRNRVNPDVFHCLTYNLPVFLNSYRSICTVHDLKFIMHPEYMHTSGAVKKFYFYWAVKLAMMKCSEVISISQSTKNDLIDQFAVNANKITVVHEASTLLRNIVPDYHKQQAVLKKFAIRGNYFFMIGSRRPHKNIANAIKAFLFFIKENSLSNWQLVISGRTQSYSSDGPLDSIQKDIAEAPIITTGYLSEDDLDILYRQASALLYPSLYEGFGLPILEAMERGTVVIASDRSSMPEVSGDAAIIVDPTNCGSIASGMEKVTQEDARLSYVEKGYARAAEFSWEKTAEQTLQVYRQVAGK